MNETLIGVIVGGLIGIVGQFLIFYFDNKKWKKERIIEVLKMRRDRLEEKYNKCIEELRKSLETNLYGDSALDTIVKTFPQRVCDAYEEVLKNTKSTPEIRKQKVAMFILETKHHLNQIDQEIIDEINK